jgi:hypothetical protein
LKNGVAVEIDVDDLDPSDTTLSDYSNERVDDLREDRNELLPGEKLLPGTSFYGGRGNTCLY